MSVNPVAANLALDITAPMVLALTTFHSLNTDGTVASSTAHVRTAVIALGTRVA